MEFQNATVGSSLKESLFPESRDEQFMREIKELYATFTKNPTNQVRNELTRMLHNTTETQRKQLHFNYRDLREKTEKINQEIKTKKRKRENFETHRTHYGARCAR